MKISDRLICRIRREFPEMADLLPEGVRLDRTYAGYLDLASGDMSWISFAPGVGRVIQSTESMTRLIKSSKLTISPCRGGYEIMADD